MNRANTDDSHTKGPPCSVASLVELIIDVSTAVIEPEVRFGESQPAQDTLLEEFG